MTTPLLEFYVGTGTDDVGRTFDEILAFSDKELEFSHDVMQWLFPLPEPSQYNPNAPLMTGKDLKGFADPQLLWRAVKAITRMADFYMASPQWITPNNHNYLRITRIIRFGTLLGLTRHRGAGHLFYTTIMSLVGEASMCSDRTRQFWKEALELRPPWAPHHPWD